MTEDPLASLKNRITLDRIPFTERGSRLLVFRAADGGLWVGLAEYETSPADNAVLSAWRFTDGDGRPLATEFVTYPHRIDGQTAIGRFTIVFADPETLLIALPGGRCGITFRAKVRDACTDASGGLVQTAGVAPRFVSYATDAVLIRNEIDTANDGTVNVCCIVDAHAEAGIALRVSLTPAVSRTVPPAPVVIAAAERTWREWFAVVPEVAEPYRAHYAYAWWVMRVNLIRPRLDPTREAVVPSKVHYAGIWNWDAYFHAIALRHADVRLAQDQIRIILDHQLTSGMLPDVIHDTGIVDRTTELPTSVAFGGWEMVGPPIAEFDLTKPPLTAWAARKVYAVDRDRSFVAAVYGPIARSQRWWLDCCDRDGNGLYEYYHPYTAGMDDNPLWDEGPPVESPELNAYLSLQSDELARMADALGRPDEARRWRAAAAALVAPLALRWDNAAGLFWSTRGGRPIPIRTPFNLMPLITGRLPAAIADRLVTTLADKRQFWPCYPVPTVALDDPTYDPWTMWRGPVWMNINYLFIEALDRSGYGQLAAELRHRTLTMAMGHEDFWEYYHPEAAEAPSAAIPMFSWSAAVFIDLAVSATTSDGVVSPARV
jgi:putative isomerase